MSCDTHPVNSPFLLRKIKKKIYPKLVMCTLKHVIEELLSRICGQSRLQKTKQQQKKRKIRPQKRKKCNNKFNKLQNVRISL